MQLFPIQRRAIHLKVLATEAEEVLRNVTLDIRDVRYFEEETDHKRFIGVVKEKGFRLSIWSRHMQHFLPLIEGLIEDTPEGCVILVRYSIFGRSFFFIGLGLCMSALAILLLAVAGEVFYTMATLGGAILVYLISIANFRQQVNISHQVLTDELRKFG